MPAQTSANSTAWSLKKSTRFPFPRYKRSAKRLGAAGLSLTSLRQPNGSEGCSAQRGRAHVFRLGADLRDHREQQLAQPGVVLLEHTDDIGRGHSGTALDPDVVVGDHRDCRVTELELPREHPLRVRSHVDHVPARLLEPA